MLGSLIVQEKVHVLVPVQMLRNPLSGSQPPNFEAGPAQPVT